MDFDKVTVSQDGEQIASLESNLGDHDQLVGGRLLIHGHGGTVVAAINGGDEHVATGQLLLVEGSVFLAGADGKQRAIIHTGEEMSGEDGGTIRLRAGNALSGPDATIEINAHQRSLVIRTAAGDVVVDLDAGVLSLGGPGQQGTIHLRGSTTFEPSRLDADSGSLSISVDGKRRAHMDGPKGDLWLGGNGVSGDIVMFGAQGDNTTSSKATIRLKGSAGDIVVGGSGVNGDLVVREELGRDRIRLKASEGNIFLGGNGADGDLMLFSKNGDNQTADTATIHLDGDAGDIVLRNADCAEDFDVAPGAEIEPGTVLVINDTGALMPSDRAYDTRVAGVVSGAGGLQPGIHLGRLPGRARTPVALAGTVYCKVDAMEEPIAVGDLLTTSATPGHAMRVSSPSKAFGSVLGKAMAAHDHGFGVIPILVALQ